MSSIFRETLGSICVRPGMFVKECDVKAVACFLDGLSMGLNSGGQENTGWEIFQSWVQGKFGISHPAWHWTDILLHETGSHKEALGIVAGVYDELVEFLKSHSSDEVDQWSAAQVSARRGNKLFAPTETPNPDVPRVCATN